MHAKRSQEYSCKGTQFLVILIAKWVLVAFIFNYFPMDLSR